MVSQALKNMILVVHPGSRIRMLTFSHPGSRIQGSKRHPIPDPDPQHCCRPVYVSTYTSSFFFLVNQHSYRTLISSPPVYPILLSFFFVVYCRYL
jgi:hypothetical protein